MTARWHAFLAWLLGPKCPMGCGQRVYPTDVQSHLDWNHAGDRS